MFKRKKEVEEYTVESFKETSVMLTTQNGSIEVQKYKLPLELEVGDILEPFCVVNITLVSLNDSTVYSSTSFFLLNIN